MNKNCINILIFILSVFLTTSCSKYNNKFEITHKNMELYYYVVEEATKEIEVIGIYNENADEFNERFNITEVEKISIDRIYYLAETDIPLLTAEDIKEWNEFIAGLEEKAGSEKEALEYLAEDYLLNAIDVSLEQIDNMQENGYSFWEIFCFVRTAETVIEREFLDSIMSGEYIKAFDEISTNSLSAKVYLLAADYSYRLLNLDKYTEFEEFTNGVLGVGAEPYPKAKNISGHLEKLYIATEYILYQKQDDYIGYNDKTEEEKRQLIIGTEKAIAVSVWWKDIYVHLEDSYIRFSLLGTGKNKDWISLEVKDLEYNEFTGNISYQYYYTNKNGSYGEDFSVETELLSINSANVEKRAIHVQELDRQLAGLRDEYNINAIRIILRNIPIINIFMVREKEDIAETNYTYSEMPIKTINDLVESVYSTTTAVSGETYVLEVIRGEISPASMITYQELRDNGISGMFSEAQHGTIEYLEKLGEKKELSDIEKALLWGNGENNNAGRDFDSLTQEEYGIAATLIEEWVKKGIKSSDNVALIRIGNIIRNEVIVNGDKADRIKNREYINAFDKVE
jgi:hypothetical protein